MAFEFISDISDSHKMHLKACLIFVVYIVVGCAFYKVVEEKPCESEEALSAPNFDEETCMEPWTVVDALYFSMVTMSTVGYGDLTPSSNGSKMFTCLYIIVGVAVVFVRVSEALGGVLGSIDDLFLRFLDRFDHKHSRSINGDKAGISGELVDLDGDGQVDFAAPPSGYGDVSLTTQGSRLWAFFHIASCVSVLGAFIGRVGQLHAKRTAQLQRYEMLLRGADKELICSLDQDGNGLDRLEFVVGMLMKLGAQLCGSPLEWSDVEPFLQRFDAMDVDKSGHLTQKDIAHMADAMANKQNLKPRSQSSTPETRATDDTDEQHGTSDHGDENVLHIGASAESSPETVSPPALESFARTNGESLEALDALQALEELVQERDLRIKALQSELENARSNTGRGSAGSFCFVSV